MNQKEKDVLFAFKNLIFALTEVCSSSSSLTEEFIEELPALQYQIDMNVSLVLNKKGDK